MSMYLLAWLCVVCLTQVVVGITFQENLLQVNAAKISPEDEFRNWVLKYQKQYEEGSDEYNQRYLVWKQNLEFIQQYNAQGKSHWLGLNSLADLSSEEYGNFYLGYNREAKQQRLGGSQFAEDGCKYCSIPLSDLPKSVDFRAQGVVTPIKNQAACGSCWAFSAIASVESINGLFGEKLVSLSEQEVMDCDKKDYSCQGGLMDDAFEFVIQNGGVDTLQDYKYKAENEKCNTQKEKRDAVTIQAFQDVPQNNETALMQAAAHQVISVAIQANQRPFQLYSGGIFDDECGDQTDHGVNVVGYGVDEESGVPYWIIRNSWGTNWGDEGYMKMRKDTGIVQGLCGVATSPSFPIKSKPNPPTPPPPSPTPNPTPTPTPSPKPFPPVIQCNAIQFCDADSSCCCKIEVLGQCLEYGCCPIPNAICCSDNLHCCPSDTECDLQKNSCITASSNSLEEFPWQNLGIPMMTKYAAHVVES